MDSHEIVYYSQANPEWRETIMASLFCPNCGFEIRCSARFCASCGTPLPDYQKQAERDAPAGSPVAGPGNTNPVPDAAAGFSFSQSRAALAQFAASLSMASGIETEAKPTIQNGRDSSTSIPSDDDDEEPDGVDEYATMAADGTITIMLRIVCNGCLGEGKHVYPPDHPEYYKILQRVGGLQPGQWKYRRDKGEFQLVKDGVQQRSKP
jgi:hypothetical protein